MKVEEILKQLKDSIEYPIITMPTYDGSDEEELKKQVDCYIQLLKGI